MQLENIETLWGIPVIKLQEYSKKYKLYFSILALFDIIIVVILVYLMFINNVEFVSYLAIMVLFSILINVFLNTYLNPARWQAFKFYKNNKKCKIRVATYDLSDKTFYSVLYCMGYKRLKQNKSLDTYKELLLSACCEDIGYAKKVMKLLKKYESESGSLTAYIMIKGNREYFIDYKLTESKIIVEEAEEETE